MRIRARAVIPSIISTGAPVYAAFNEMAARLKTSVEQTRQDEERQKELLLFFMLHVDIVFSREDLYEKIWGLEAMGDNATGPSTSTGHKHIQGKKQVELSGGDSICGLFLHLAPLFSRA